MEIIFLIWNLVNIDVDDDYFELRDIDSYIIDTNSSFEEVEELIVEYQNPSLYSLFNKELRDFYKPADYLELSDYSNERSYNEDKRIKKEELNDAIYIDQEIKNVQDLKVFKSYTFLLEYI